MGRDHLSAGRVALVVNPASGGGRGARVAAAVRARLRRGAAVDMFVGTSAEESAVFLARAADSHDAVIVLGGDGIVHLAVQSLAGTSTPLGIVPAGTGNDAAAALGLPDAPLDAADAVLAALAASSSRQMDLGRTNGGRWFATVMCAGFDSAVNERANRMRWPRGRRRYDLAILAEMARLRARPFTIQLDDRLLEMPATLVAVGNGPQYGGGKRITSGARLDDGRFAVTVVGPVSRWTLARLAPTLPRAGHIGHPAVTTYLAQRVRVFAADTVAYADGERLGELPQTATCVRGALRVLTPAELPNDPH